MVALVRYVEHSFIIKDIDLQLWNRNIISQPKNKTNIIQSTVLCTVKRRFRLS